MAERIGGVNRLAQSDLLISMGHGRGTNPTCDRYEESFDGCGCQRCGKPLGDHRPPAS